MKPDEWCVVYSNHNSVGIDGYDGLNPNGPKPQLAVFSNARDAHDHRDARTATMPGITFQVIKLS